MNVNYFIKRDSYLLQYLNHMMLKIKKKNHIRQSHFLVLILFLLTMLHSHPHCYFNFLAFQKRSYRISQIDLSVTEVSQSQQAKSNGHILFSPLQFPGELYQIFKDKIIAILHSLFQKIEAGRVCPNSLYEANITLILKPEKDFSKKKKATDQ